MDLNCANQSPSLKIFLYTIFIFLLPVFLPTSNVLAGNNTIADTPLKPQDFAYAVPLQFGADWVWGPGDGKADHTLDAEMVFVGYGIVAPDEKWDDFKGMDVKGKVIVMMVNDPAPTAAEANRFNGAGLTYYGRWTYKLEEAARQGAAGVLLIHTDASASYGWSVVQNSWANAERFQLTEGKVGSGLQGWMTNDTARKVFAAGGQDLDKLRAAAEDGRPECPRQGRGARAGALAGRIQRGWCRAGHGSGAERRSGDLLGTLGSHGQARHRGRHDLQRRRRQRIGHRRAAGDGRRSSEEPGQA